MSFRPKRKRSGEISTFYFIIIEISPKKLLFIGNHFISSLKIYVYSLRIGKPLYSFAVKNSFGNSAGAVGDYTRHLFHDMYIIYTFLALSAISDVFQIAAHILLFIHIIRQITALFHRFARIIYHCVCKLKTGIVISSDFKRRSLFERKRMHRLSPGSIAIKSIFMSKSYSLAIPYTLYMSSTL